MCGGVRWELSGVPGAASYCHCRRCQRRSGTAASTQVRIRAEQLRILQGEELVHAYRPPDGFEKLFCSTCGSALFSRHRDDPAVMSVRLGGFDDEPGFRPQLHQHVASAAAWEALPEDGLPRYDGSPPSS